MRFRERRCSICSSPDAPPAAAHSRPPSGGALLCLHWYPCFDPLRAESEVRGAADATGADRVTDEPFEQREAVGDGRWRLPLGGAGRAGPWAPGSVESAR